jgi:rhodanese-related sulfurtransferase
MKTARFGAFAATMLVAAASIADQAGGPAPGQAASAPAAAASASLPLISPQALLERQAKRDLSLFVLDVRTPQEYAAGHVPGAVNVPYDQVASHLAEIPKDKDVVLYCRSGRRTGLAAEVLEANGYTKLGHLQGDMEAWLKDGRPVESGDATGRPKSP